MNNEITFSDLPQVKNLADVDKFLVGCIDGSFGYITAAELRRALVPTGVAEMLPEGYAIALTNEPSE